MNVRRVLAIARKESLHIARDPRSLIMAIFIPMLMLFLFGYALTLDVDDVPLLVWDQNGSHASREFVSRFAGSRYFSLRGYAQSYEELGHALDTREALVGLVIPHDFARWVETGRTTEVQLLVDASDANTATLAIGYAEMVTQNYSRDVALQIANRPGGAPLRTPLDLRPRVWFNADLESRNYIIPGLIGVIMMVIAAMLTSLTVAREWEQGTMEQLIATPVRGSELFVGKLLPYFALGMLDVLLSVLMGEFLFKVPMRGSVALLFGLASLFLVGVLAMGMLISIVAKSQLLASQIAMVSTFLPSFLLSGFMFAIANMPKPIQVITYVVPARYFVAILKSVYLKGVGMEVLFGQAALLVIYALVMIFLANVKFQKKLV